MNDTTREILSVHLLLFLNCLNPPKLDVSMVRMIRGDVVPFSAFYN